MEAPAERFELIARLSAEGVPEIEESDAVRLSRSLADPLAVRQLLLDLPDCACPAPASDGGTASALGLILPALEHHVRVRPKAPGPPRQRPKTATPLAAVVVTGMKPEEDAASRFNPSLDDIAKALLADAGGQKVKPNKYSLLVAALTLVTAIGLSFWLYR